MAFGDDPIKVKKIFKLTAVLLVVFFLGTVVLGLFYYRLNKNYHNLKTENENLLALQVVTPSPTPSPTPDPLVKENQDLKKQLADDQTKDKKAKAYNDFFKYLNTIIEKHNGFDGWTTAEYQEARTKAEATGDSNFISLIDWAWNDTSASQIDRLVRVWKAIDTGIGNNL